MVVVSNSWVKHVPVCPSSVINSYVVTLNDNIMAAKAILTCRPNSHNFQERTLILDQPVKVGRSVARVKPTPNNAIFDCKVLSRHHALLRYENGKFYLQDTKSSNGTFVNNNKLSPETENHELSSGDIVQFGVDVVENNRKVTHGCIVATIRLFLPDGKEAKASPSISSGDRHGMVPLDDLYRLNQIIQEANQREQCLETKLTALQQIVDETRKSAEESWQAFVGEERLLSRVSALENQLQQANKNWGEDRLREELNKIHEESESYQVAAKEALEKLHSEKLEAVALAMEQERARITAEQEALLAKEQFVQAQLELETVAHKLTEQLSDAEEQRIKLQQREQELGSKLESESGKLLDLQLKLHELNALSIQDFQGLGFMEHSEENLIYKNDMKCKEDLLAENEMAESLLYNSNGIDNHINITMGPVEEKTETEKPLEESSESENGTEQTKHEETRRVTFTMPEGCVDKEEDDESRDGSDSTCTNEKDYNSDHVDSKTLKYQFQSAQNELKRRIEVLESISEADKLRIIEMNKTVEQERETSRCRLVERETLKQELILLQQRWKESCNENQRYKDKLENLHEELEETQCKLKQVDENTSEKQQQDVNKKSVITYEQLVSLEEELVMMKERFAQVSEEKLGMQKDLLALTKQYNMACNRSYNKYFFYVAPLVFMVVYLLVSAMIS